MLRSIARALFTNRTRLLIKLDYLRWLARRKAPRQFVPNENRLHLACGTRRIKGWVNADMGPADLTFDVMTTPWPIPDATFNVVVCQHMIEHFDLESELLPVLLELRRVCKPGAEVWISTPDLEIMCREYVRNKGRDVKNYMVAKDHKLCADDVPSQHYVNLMFHALGHHRNLYDLELLSWALVRTGWGEITRVNESDLLARFPDFPPRHDDFETLAVRAIAI